LGVDEGAGAEGAEPDEGRGGGRLTRAADGNYAAKDYRGAVRKLGQAATLCETRGCTAPVQAQIYASLAIVHWNGTQDFDSATEALRTMVRLDPEHPLDRRATAELRVALDTAKEDVRQEATAKAAGAQPGPATPPRKSESEMTAQEKDEEFRRKVEERKANHLREALDAQKKAEADAAQFAAEQKKAEAARKAEEATRAAADKKEAARKAAEDKKEAARKAAEDKKAEAARRVLEAQKAAEEKKAAARKAVEDKKADDARKAEEARKAKEEERLRAPPPVGKIQENAWHQQTVGYPPPIYVKLHPLLRVSNAPTDVEKVVVDYSGPAMPIPQQLDPETAGQRRVRRHASVRGDFARGRAHVLHDRGQQVQQPGGHRRDAPEAEQGADHGGRDRQFPISPARLPPSDARRRRPRAGRAGRAAPPARRARRTRNARTAACAQRDVRNRESCAADARLEAALAACFGCELGARGQTAPRGNGYFLAIAAARLFRRRASTLRGFGRGRGALRWLAAVFAALALAWLSPGCRPPEPEAACQRSPDADGDGIPDDGRTSALNEKEDGLPPNPTDGCKSTDRDGDGSWETPTECPNERKMGCLRTPKDGCASVDPTVTASSARRTSAPTNRDEERLPGRRWVPLIPPRRGDENRGQDQREDHVRLRKATIEQASQNLLDEIAFVINDNPQIEPSKLPVTQTRSEPTP
jgi:chemotaxis protein histidine kinase CheA